MPQIAKIRKFFSIRLLLRSLKTLVKIDPVTYWRQTVLEQSNRRPCCFQYPRRHAGLPDSLPPDNRPPRATLADALGVAAFTASLDPRGELRSSSISADGKWRSSVRERAGWSARRRTFFPRKNRSPNGRQATSAPSPMPTFRSPRRPAIELQALGIDLEANLSEAGQGDKPGNLLPNENIGYGKACFLMRRARA